VKRCQEAIVPPVSPPFAGLIEAAMALRPTRAALPAGASCAGCDGTPRTAACGSAPARERALGCARAPGAGRSLREMLSFLGLLARFGFPGWVGSVQHLDGPASPLPPAEQTPVKIAQRTSVKINGVVKG